MRKPWSFALALLAVAAVGCEGALSGGTGGTGGGGGDIMTGGAGTTGSGGTAGYSYAGNYTWAGSFVYVGSTERPDVTFDGFKYLSQEDIAINAMGSLPAATDYPPTNGARVIAHYGCVGTAPYSVDVEGCPRSPDGTTSPGCVSFSVSDQGLTTGEYIDVGGDWCTVRSGAASIYLPLPEFAQAPGSPREAARGSFNFFCDRADGALWYISGTFGVPAESTVTLCVN